MLVRGIGVDVIEIERIRKSLQNPRFIFRILTERERQYCENEEQIAGRFSAKEAIMKALGQRLPWKDIEIINEDNGKPRVILYGKAKKMVEDGEILLSISHSSTTAVAVALFIKGSPSREESP